MVNLVSKKMQKPIFGRCKPHFTGSHLPSFRQKFKSKCASDLAGLNPADSAPTRIPARCWYPKDCSWREARDSDGAAICPTCRNGNAGKKREDACAQATLSYHRSNPYLI